MSHVISFSFTLKYIYIFKEHTCGTYRKTTPGVWKIHLNNYVFRYMSKGHRYINGHYFGIGDNRFWLRA